MRMIKGLPANTLIKGGRRRMKKQKRIFSGEYSRDMWQAINTAKTIRDLRQALYLICCRIQELEALRGGEVGR